MRNQQHSAKATNVAVNPNVANNAIVRLMQRVAQVQALRAAKNTARRNAAKQQAYQLQVAQLAAEYGMPAPSFAPQVSAYARANSETIAPSHTSVTVQGTAYKPCKAVHALCATLPATATRAEMLQLCTDHGINAATASTQVGIYRKAAAAAAAQ